MRYCEKCLKGDFLLACVFLLPRAADYEFTNLLAFRLTDNIYVRKTEKCVNAKN